MKQIATIFIFIFSLQASAFQETFWKSPPPLVSFKRENINYSGLFPKNERELAEFYDENFPLIRDNEFSDKIFKKILGKEIDIEKLLEFERNHKHARTNISDYLCIEARLKNLAFWRFEDAKTRAIIIADIVSHFRGNAEIERLVDARQRIFDEKIKGQKPNEIADEDEILHFRFYFLEIRQKSYRNFIFDDSIVGAFVLYGLDEYADSPAEFLKLYEDSGLKKYRGELSKLYAQFIEDAYNGSLKNLELPKFQKYKPKSRQKLCDFYATTFQKRQKILRAVKEIEANFANEKQ